MIWSCPIYLTCMFLGTWFFVWAEEQIRHLLLFTQSTKYISLSLRQLRMHFLKEKNHIYIWSKLQASVKCFLLCLASNSNKCLGNLYSYMLMHTICHKLTQNSLTCEAIVSMACPSFLLCPIKTGSWIHITPMKEWLIVMLHFKKKSFVIKGFKTCHW